MSVAAGRKDKRGWLGQLAEPHEPRARPYYLHVPRDRSQPAPGWYWIPKGSKSPEYLGASFFDAETYLRGLDA